MDDEGKKARLTQYLDFVKLYTEVHNQANNNNNAKQEANLIWKEKIQKESSDQLSKPDYLEQLALLRAKKISKNNKVMVLLTGIRIKRIKEFLRLKNIFQDGGMIYLDFEIPIEFSCEGARKSVEIAGSFNNWTPQPLKYSKEDRDWLTILNLSPGVYHYKYVVDGEWMHNPLQEWEEDGEGNINNVMKVEDRLTKRLRELREERERLQVQ